MSGESLSALGRQSAATGGQSLLEAGNVPKPTGEYVPEMTSDGAWPETDESVHTSRAAELDGRLTKVKTAIDSWNSGKALIFNGVHVWSGVGSLAAAAVANGCSDALEQHRTDLEGAVQWHKNAATAIGETKTAITKTVAWAHWALGEIRRVAAEKELDSTDAERVLVNTAWRANKQAVDAKAMSFGGKPGPQEAPPFSDDEINTDEEGVLGKDGFGDDLRVIMASSSGLSDEPSLNAGAPPASPIPQRQNADARSADAASTSTSLGTEAPPSTPASELESPPASAPYEGAPHLGQEAPVSTPGGFPSTPQAPPGRVSGQSPAGTPVSGSSPPLGSVSGPQSSGGNSPTGLFDSVSNGSEASSTNPLASNPAQAGQTPTNPVEAFLQGYSDAEPSVNPASGGEVPTAAPAQTAPLAPDLMNTSTQPAGPNPSGSSSAAGSAAPVGQPGPSGPMNSGSSMSGGGLGMPLAPPPTVSPSAPPPMAPAPAAPMPPPAAAAGAAPAPVPVSAARRERDAIAAAGRRGNDPARVAVRIAAALNAIPTQDFGFYWVTALTVDGTIVVANSYGIGFIPEGVKLPERVKMASADESIPAADRGKWATYPVLSLQGWAEQHSTALRMVIATESQFQGFDPGAAKVVLQPDDIPDHGQMQGRSRLEVIAPAAAAQLATVTDSALPELLPVAPADLTPPPDETFNKWFNVMKPLMSRADERGHVHLQAFVEFANYAQVRAVYAAHTAADPVALRGAVAEWFYWQHLGVLTSDALAELQPS